MDFLKQTYEQFSDLLKSMPISQRMMLVSVTVLVIGGFGYLMFQGAGDGNYVPVSVGKAFSVEELIRAEETLIQAGKTDFKRRGQRLLVPEDRVEEYNSILIASGTLPQNWAEEWEQGYLNIGPFANNKQMEARKEIARAKLASQMLRSMPDIDHADVVWDYQEGRGFNRKPRSTATVSVRPKPGRELPSTLIHAIRVSIAGMKADLRPEDVTVLDLGRGIAHQQTMEDDPFNDRVLQRIYQLKEMYRHDILAAIDYIDDVRVAVNVDIDKVKTSVSREQVMETKGTTLMSTTESVKDNSNRYAVQKEPGQNANGPMNLAGQSAPQQTSDSTKTKEASLTAPSFKVIEQALIGALPENVRVSVVIPESYFRVVALQSGEVTAESTEDEIRKIALKYQPDIQDAVKARVSKIIPIAAGLSPDDFIDVGSYIPSPEAEMVSTVSWTETMGGFFSKWGSPILLTLFALWAFWMLNKTVRAQAEAPLPELEPIEKKSVSGEDAEEQSPYDDELTPKSDTKRVDHLQHLVKKNPEMTASIISQWIQEAK